MTLAPIYVAGRDETAARAALTERLRVYGYSEAEAREYATAARVEPAKKDPHDFFLVGELRGGVGFKVEVRVA